MYNAYSLCIKKIQNHEYIYIGHRYLTLPLIAREEIMEHPECNLMAQKLTNSYHHFCKEYKTYILFASIV
jgi:hypothetical protein